MGGEIHSTTAKISTSSSMLEAISGSIATMPCTFVRSVMVREITWPVPKDRAAFSSTAWIAANIRVRRLC